MLLYLILNEWACFFLRELPDTAHLGDYTTLPLYGLLAAKMLFISYSFNE